MPLVYLPGRRSWKSIAALTVLYALLIGAGGLVPAQEALAQDRFLYSGALVRVQPRTRAFSALSHSLPPVTAKGFLAERLSDQVLKLERAAFRSSSSTQQEVPQPYSKKTNPCRRATVRRALAELRIPLTACSPNWAQFSSAVPNDPGFSSQYGATLMSLQSAWDKSTGSNNIIIGVIDTGISLTHPDLVSNLWTNPLEIAGNGLDDDANGYIDDVNGINAITNSGNPDDDNSHGTHVAGIIAASGNNGVGIAGVTWRAKVVGLKFLDASGSGSTSNAIKCIYYSTQMKRLGYRVVASNNSWGGGGYSSALGSAIQDAASQNVLFIAAAGNSAQNLDVSPSYPASYNISNVISVASVTSASALSSFSNYGTSVSIAAPGSGIYSTIPGGYATYSGTSMASPQVAGIAALASSACQSDLSAAQLKDVILSTGVTVGALSGKVATGSIANGNGAVVKAQTICPSTTPVPATATPTATPTRTATATPTRTATATAAPTIAPTLAPTVAPPGTPTSIPTSVPTFAPTSVPTIAPTSVPTVIPTRAPTAVPTAQPTNTPRPTATPKLPLAVSISPSTSLRGGQQASISIRNAGSALRVAVGSRLVGKVNGQSITFICPDYSVSTVAGSSTMLFSAPNSINYFEKFEASTSVNRASARASVTIAGPRLTPPASSSIQAKIQTLLRHAGVVCNTVRSSARAASRRAARRK